MIRILNSTPMLGSALTPGQSLASRLIRAPLKFTPLFVNCLPTRLFSNMPGNAWQCFSMQTIDSNIKVCLWRQTIGTRSKEMPVDSPTLSHCLQSEQWSGMPSVSNREYTRMFFERITLKVEKVKVCLSQIVCSLIYYNWMRLSNRSSVQR